MTWHVCTSLDDLNMNLKNNLSIGWCWSSGSQQCILQKYLWKSSGTHFHMMNSGQWILVVKTPNVACDFFRDVVLMWKVVGKTSNWNSLAVKPHTSENILNCLSYYAACLVITNCSSLCTLNVWSHYSNTDFWCHVGIHSSNCIFKSALWLLCFFKTHFSFTTISSLGPVWET